MTQHTIDIHKEMTIDDLFAKHPQKAQKLALELTKTGLNCVGCSASTWETLESGCLRHGMSESEMQALVSRLQAIIAQQSDPGTISITEKAAHKFREFCELENKQGWGLRFDQEPAGCSGFRYVLDFSEKPEADDTVITNHGLEIHVNNQAFALLQGCEIDFIDGLEGGFKVSNPNVKSSCGCGSSHGY